MIPLPFGGNNTHLIGSETFYRKNFVVIVKEFSIDRRIWHEEALRISNEQVCRRGVAYNTITEKTTVRSPQARKMICVV